MRNVYVNNFCLGDSVTKLYEILGEPTRTELEIIDKAIENTEPAKNIYYYGKHVYFSEPYLVAKGRIGEINIYENYNFKLHLTVGGQNYTFSINDTLNMEYLEQVFPISIIYSKSLFNEIEEQGKYAYIVLRLKEQDQYFPYPYPLITKLALTYSNGLLESIRTSYYAE